MATNMFESLYRKIINRRRMNLPRISYASVIPNDQISIIEPVDKPGGLTLEELAIVIGICKKLGDSSVLELGAYRGRTSVNIAHNCKGCKITTFDLPLNTLDDKGLKHSLLSKDKAVVEHDKRGFFFRKYPGFDERITHLYGDSASFDFKPYYDSYDLVFIDASHKYENVIIDSENALKLLRKQGGVVLWHDYSMDNMGVVRAINQIRKKYKLDIGHIKRTKLAYLKMNYGFETKKRF